MELEVLVTFIVLGFLGYSMGKYLTAWVLGLGTIGALIFCVMMLPPTGNALGDVFISYLWFCILYPFVVAWMTYLFMVHGEVIEEKVGKMIFRERSED